LRHSLSEVQDAAARIQQALFSKGKKSDKKGTGPSGEDSSATGKNAEEVARSFLKSPFNKPD
jgi:hypothetical protein